jgi:hypothetical protein
VVCVLAEWWSVCRDLGDRGAGAGFVDDGFTAGPGGDQGLGGEVVDGAGQAAGGVVDEGGGIVAEQGVGTGRLGLATGAALIAITAASVTVALTTVTGHHSAPAQVHASVRLRDHGSTYTTANAVRQPTDHHGPERHIEIGR